MSESKNPIEYIQATRAGLERVRTIVTSLNPDSLRGALENEWTVSSMLAHLAFWDRWVETRWDHFSRTGSFHELPDDITTLVNQAALSHWLALPSGESVRLCLDSASSVTSRIEQLSTDEVKAALKTNRPAMVDRTLHWYPHLDEVEAVRTS
ncbi:MAG: hypothetical protein KY429_11180 [Actinobacteria bacterium]|nr:hypothetical protein [Actinomycetota bacterium]